MKDVLQVLLVEDSDADAELVLRSMRQAGFHVQATRVETEPDFLAALEAAPEVILSDFELPRFSGLRALELTRERHAELPFLIVSGTIGEDMAVRVMKTGATDIVPKERLAKLGPAITRALADAKLVSERRRSDKALAESEARFRTLVEQASDGIFMITLEGVCLEANARAGEILGYTREQLLSTNLWSLMADDKRQRIDGEVGRLSEGEVRMSDWRIRRGDGAYADVEVAARLVADRKILASVRDLTERKRAEAALREEQQRFANVAAMAPGVLHSIHMAADDTVSLLYVSPRVRDIFGIDSETIRGDANALISLWHPADRERVIRSIYASRRALTPWHEEYRVVHPEKGVIWIEGRSMPVPEPDGGTTWHGVLTDVTDRKRAEAVLKEQLALEKRITRLAAAAPGVMYMLRKHGAGPVGLTYASDKFEEVLGVPSGPYAEDMSGLFERVHGEDLPAVLARIARSAVDLEPYLALFRFDHPQKGQIWIETRSTPTREPDGTIVWYGFGIDVTERVALEEQFRQSQKMEAFGQLASGVAHDFNNLLTIIQGNASMLLEGSPLEQAACVDDIVQATRRASSLTRQLLLFSRRQPMKSADLDLSDVVSRMAKMLRPILGEDIALTSDLVAGLPTVHADPGMIEQIVLNLAVNARDAMPRGGCLRISTSLQTVDAADWPNNPDARSGNYVRLTVADTGPGIPPEIRTRIFEPFFTTKEVGKGTGLGLATVHGIVKQHRGFLALESELGRGATFHVFLPSTTRAASAEPQPKRESLLMPTGQETILVVEDELSVRTFVTRVLKRCGYNVLTAPSGVSALKVWEQRRGKVDLLLTDMVMPDGMTGRELADRLATECPSLRIVYTSGFSADWGVNGVALVNGVNFLQKPYEPHKLAQTVRAALDRNEP